MDDDRLIACVRQYEVLYNPTHTKYMDTSLKNDIWTRIGTELEVDGMICKARWNNIRDTYRKSVKKSYTKLGTRKCKKYKYARELAFLNKHFTAAKSNSVDEAGEEDQEEEDGMHLDLSFKDDFLHEEDFESQSSSSFSQTPAKLTMEKNDPLSNADSQKSDAEAPVEYYLCNKHETSQTSTHHNPHPVDAFLGGIAPTLKTFSPYSLHLAKSEIFAIVQKYELKTIMGESSHHGEPSLDQSQRKFEKF